jgi:hypothetical protein
LRKMMPLKFDGPEAAPNINGMNLKKIPDET